MSTQKYTRVNITLPIELFEEWKKYTTQQEGFAKIELSGFVAYHLRELLSQKEQKIAQALTLRIPETTTETTIQIGQTKREIMIQQEKEQLNKCWNCGNPNNSPINQYFCSGACEIEYKNKHTDTHQCPICGENLREKQTYCSDRCRKRASRARSNK